MTATIRRDSGRFRQWKEIFQTDTITILEPPKANANGALRMLVDARCLDAGQLQRLVVMVARQRRLVSDRVRAEIVHAGSVAISAEDVDVQQEEARLFE